MTSKKKQGASDISLTQPLEPAQAEILGKDALEFIGELTRAFGARVDDLLARRSERQKAITNGAMPDFLAETREIRAGTWKVGPIPQDLLDRRVEITGPTDRKMIINALNSGARVFMADCEDSLSPTWHNIVQGQINLRDAAARRIELQSGGKHYRLREQTAGHRRGSW